MGAPGTGVTSGAGIPGAAGGTAVSGTTTGGGAPHASSPARRAWDAARWWIRQLSGEGKYDAYVAHHRAHHPDVAPLSVGEFWRSEHERAERNPGSRCC